MNVTIIEILPQYLHKVNIQWTLTTAVSSIIPEYDVERSGSPEGPWEKINTDPITGIYYTDDLAQLFSMTRDIYYRVKAFAPGVEIYSDPRSLRGTMERRQWLIWRKINHDEEIMLKKFNGVPLKVFKRKHFGERCVECFDPVTKMTIRKKCSVCKGTSWIQGYYEGIDTWGHIKPLSVRTDDTAAGSIIDVGTTNCMLLNFPVVFKDDIIKEVRTNIRWRVVSKQPTELTRATVHQDIVLSRVPRDQIEYNL
jgi:hypothetical protein